jgi:hypothetical protein
VATFSLLPLYVGVHEEREHRKTFFTQIKTLLETNRNWFSSESRTPSVRIPGDLGFKPPRRTNNSGRRLLLDLLNLWVQLRNSHGIGIHASIIVSTRSGKDGPPDVREKYA